MLKLIYKIDGALRNRKFVCMSRRFRCLSVRQPFAGLIALGYKTIEARSWKTEFRGRLYIHTGLNQSPTPLYNVNKNDLDHHIFQIRGKIIAHVNLVDCIQIDGSHSNAAKFEICAIANGFVFESPRVLEEPILAKGKLGLFMVETA